MLMSVTGTDIDPFAAAEAAAAELTKRSGMPRHDVAIVLGSGWQDAANGIGSDAVELATADLPGFVAPTVAGHQGRVRSVDIAGRRVLVLVGRVHLYEGRSPAEVVHPIRMAVAAGASVVVLTNAAGGIDPAYRVGQTVLIRDHLNLTGRSPLGGPPPPDGYAARFVDLSDCWSPRLRELAKQVDPDLTEGVYAALPGPHYETPAEIAMLRSAGADLVGMSTVLEAIAARHLGAEVLGLSLVTNAAAGVADLPVGHEEVLAAGAAAAPGLARLIEGVVARL
jgi:purine-nucleoside phosphorylase